MYPIKTKIFRGRKVDTIEVEMNEFMSTMDIREIININAVERRDGEIVIVMVYRLGPRDNIRMSNKETIEEHLKHLKG